MARYHGARLLVKWRGAEPQPPPEPKAPAPAILAPSVAAAAATTRSTDVPLRADHIDVHYGGLQALADVSICASDGEIVGLMGPNGAGKTTLFDTLSGRLRPDRGSVHLNGDNVTHVAAYARARLGLGRTFQQARLFDDLTLLEVMHLALRCPAPPGSNGAVDRPRSSRARTAVAGDIVDLLGLGPWRHRYVTELSTGTRRQAELACVAALGSSVLLLDEPTAGFAQPEVLRFVEALRSLRAYLGATVVVIDHDVPMMLSLADRLYVLEAGVVIAEGPPDVVRNDQRVMAAYTGELRTATPAGAQARLRS
jgi:ABC-type branched-subunit amino acid transport system ATPase component